LGVDLLRIEKFLKMRLLQKVYRGGVEEIDFSTSRSSWALKLGKRLAESLEQLFAKFGCFINSRVMSRGAIIGTYVCGQNFYLDDRGRKIWTSRGLVRVAIVWLK
jgi:hypothetical protein